MKARIACLGLLALAAPAFTANLSDFATRELTTS